MGDFARTRLGGGVVGAVSIVVGVFLFGIFGWFDEPTVSTYVSGAIAGFVGGYVGAVFRERREGGT